MGQGTTSLHILSGALILTTALAASACSDASRSMPTAPTAAEPTAASGSATGSNAASPSMLSPASNSSDPRYADISNQGDTGVYAPNGAMLVRQPNGLQARVSMPTPAPGTYNYPAGTTEGQPEVFTLWIFVFNHPDLCSDHECGSNDLGDTPAQGGAYNGGGHFASGNQLTIAGQIAVGEAPFRGVPLQLPSTAEVHLAVAPHGGVDPSQVPAQFRVPAGSPPFWWVAIFH